MPCLLGAGALNRQPFDPARIFATGLSNGGTMANRLGCDLSQFFAAIAPVAGAHSGFLLCDVSQAISVLAIHGTDDNVIPYEGNGEDVPPVRMWVEAWAERDGCALAPIYINLPQAPICAGCDPGPGLSPTEWRSGLRLRRSVRAASLHLGF